MYYTYLVKYGLTRADETPFEHFLSVVGILHRVTYVENLTFVGDVGVISWMAEREKKTPSSKWQNHSFRVLYQIFFGGDTLRQLCLYCRLYF